VHRVLELVDLASPTRQEVRRLAEVAAAEQEIPALASDVTARVMGALQAPIVREAAETRRYWREVYVVVPDGERFVEGYIDLLLETGDGELVVVDYKTDRVDSEADIAAKVEHYRPQLTAYADAISRATGRSVARSMLVFAARDGARQVDLEPSSAEPEPPRVPAGVRRTRDPGVLPALRAGAPRSACPRCAAGRSAVGARLRWEPTDQSQTIESQRRASLTVVEGTLTDRRTVP